MAAFSFLNWVFRPFSGYQYCLILPETPRQTPHLPTQFVLSCIRLGIGRGAAVVVGRARFALMAADMLPLVVQLRERIAGVP